MPSRSLTALSIAPNAKEWLVHTRKARILHVFKHACNLINDNREVLSVVTSEIGDGPFNILLKNPEFSFLNLLDVVTPITIDANCVSLGEIIVDTHQAKTWSPNPDWKQLQSACNLIGIQLLNSNERLQLLAPTNSMIEYLEALLIMAGVVGKSKELSEASSRSKHRSTLPETTYHPNIVPAPQIGTLPEPGFILYAAQPIKELCYSIIDADIRGCQHAVQQLAGLGPGLTPAGDDFILGTIFAARIIHPCELAIRLTEKIAEAAAPLTTSLSAAWIRAAGRGEAGILWHQFFAALLFGESETIQISTQRLLKVGHTSGADSLAGFLAPFFLFMSQRTDQ